MKMNSVEVLDISGRIILQIPSDGNQLSFNISTLSEGSYFLSIQTQEGKAIKRFTVK
jgi:hypothetical protein